MELKLPDGFDDAMKNLQSQLNRASNPIQMPMPDLSSMEFREDPVEYLEKIIERLEKLENKHWTQKYPVAFGILLAIIGGIAGAIATLVIQ